MKVPGVQTLLVDPGMSKKMNPRWSGIRIGDSPDGTYDSLTRKDRRGQLRIE